jgi:hypothetical protein
LDYKFYHSNVHTRNIKSYVKPVLKNNQCRNLGSMVYGWHLLGSLGNMEALRTLSRPGGRKRRGRRERKKERKRERRMKGIKMHRRRVVRKVRRMGQ